MAALLSSASSSSAALVAAQTAYALLASTASADDFSVLPPEEMLDSDGRPALAFLVQLRFPYEGVGFSDGFGDGEAAGAERSFAGDLRVWAQNCGGGLEAAAMLMVMLPLGDVTADAAAFPLRPPEVRLLRPMLRPGCGPGSGGGVANGFFVGVPQLLPLGWSPSLSLPMVLRCVRDCLQRNGARVAVDTNAFYNVQAYASARRMALAAPRYSRRHKSGFRRALVSILDANVTTLIAGAIMFQFGAGPVRGFAWSLSIGVFTSVFSAVMISQVLLGWWFRAARPKKLPIL